MTDPRTPIFEAIRERVPTRVLMNDDVARIHALLDGLKVPRTLTMADTPGGVLAAATSPAEPQNARAGLQTAGEAVTRSTGLRDEAAFFAVLREGLKPLNQSQVDGIKFLLGKMASVAWPLAWAAYGLETAWHETAERMQPVREGLDVSDAWRRRNLRYYPWYGRGYPQTTWEENYRKADEKLGLGGTLIANADRMLEPDIAADTMIRGMEEGWFAGDRQGRHTLARHLPDRTTSTRAQKLEARRIINGTDKREKIANEAEVWERALRAGGWA